jgi:hypothetical protein
MAVRRLELGFEGGAVLRVSMEEADVQALTSALQGGGTPGWTQITIDDGVCWVDLSKLTFTRIWSESSRNVGFRGA